MGGINSGRSSRPKAWISKKLTMGALSGLNISEFIKKQRAAPDSRFVFGDIQLELEESNILLTSKNGALVTPSIQISSMPCHYGGFRHFALCPICSKRVSTLYKYKTCFACRICFRMHYPSQNQPLYYKMLLKVEKAHKQIDNDPWTKPKGMRKKTFDRLRLLYFDFDEKAEIANFFRCKTIRQVEGIFKKYGSAITAAEFWMRAQGF